MLSCYVSFCGERTVGYWLLQASSLAANVCVAVCWSALPWSTCVLYYCNKAAQPPWGDSECQRPESRSEAASQHPMEGETHARMLGPLTVQRGSQGEPQLCVRSITLSLFKLSTEKIWANRIYCRQRPNFCWFLQITNLEEIKKINVTTHRPLTATCKKKKLSSPSLPHLVPDSPPAFFPHLLLPCMPTDLWPSFYLICPSLPPRSQPPHGTVSPPTLPTSW